MGNERKRLSYCNRVPVNVQSRLMELRVQLVGKGMAYQVTVQAKDGFSVSIRWRGSS